jgi:S1-C subfamily serine protease
MEDWLSVADKYRNSVLQLICTRGSYNPFRPQQPPGDRKASGTGFIIDINNGLVITNAHVVSNAISISGRMMSLGEHDLSLRVISICREKDIALCQLNNEAITLIKSRIQGDINMVFGDNMLLRETDPVIAIGYPLGQKSIKYTTGVVSGFYANGSSDGDPDEMHLTEEEEPSYIQITAPINPGNSGGPLLNRKGQVVGVNAAGYTFSQNVSYAIGSRTVLGIYDELVSPLKDNTKKMPYLVITPKYAFSYNRASPALLQLACNNNGAEGVYIKRVYPNSVFDTLKEGDILSQIIYNDIYFGNPAAFDVINRVPIEGTPTVATLDKYGDLTLDILCDSNKKENAGSPPCRKLSIKELFDMIPIGKEVSITICRQTPNDAKCETKDCGMYRISTIFKYVPSKIRNPLYPRITPYKYEILAGLSIGELTMNHIANERNLEEYSKGKKRYEPVLVVNQVFPDTSAYHARVFKEGSIIEEINGTKVTTIDELRNVISKPGDYIIIVSKERDKFVVSRKDAIKEDTYALSQFNLDNYKYLLQ